MSSIPEYDQASFEDLRARTQYESWLLEAVYDIAGSPVLVDRPDQMVYPASGAMPTLRVLAQGIIIIGDWRPQFLEAGAPLVFITSFKLLDMLLEWGVIALFQSYDQAIGTRIARVGGCVA